MAIIRKIFRYFSRVRTTTRTAPVVFDHCYRAIFVFGLGMFGAGVILKMEWLVGVFLGLFALSILVFLVAYIYLLFTNVDALRETKIEREEKFKGENE